MQIRKCVVVILLSLSLLACGCDLASDQKILEGFQKYFPAAYLLKFDQRILWVQTDVDNISRDFASEVFRDFVAKPEARNLKLGMSLSGYQMLALGFKDFSVLWLPKENRFWVFDSEETDQWSKDKLGYKISDLKHKAQIVNNPQTSPTISDLCRLAFQIARMRPMSDDELQVMRRCQENPLTE